MNWNTNVEERAKKGREKEIINIDGWWKMGNGGGTFACNPRENCRYPRNISANYSPRRNGRVVLEQSRRYAYNLKCFKMEIKRRLRAFCKATRRALEYIIEQCQHLFLITFRWSTRPRKFLSRAARILSFIRCWNMRNLLSSLQKFYTFLFLQLFHSSSKR